MKEAKEANVIVKAYSNDDALEHIAQLRKNGYTRKGNCFWVEIWQKPNGWTVQLERDY